MKAIVHSRYGAPDVLELKDIDQPVVSDDAVLVRVHAAAVGKGDWLTVQALRYVARMRYGLPNPRHGVPGFDVDGRVEAIGHNVTQLQPGDEVFGGPGDRRRPRRRLHPGGLHLDWAGLRPDPGDGWQPFPGRSPARLTLKGTLVLVGGSGGRWFMGTGRTLRAVVLSPFVGQRLRSFLSKPQERTWLF